VCGHDDFVAKVPNIGLGTTFSAGDAIQVGCTQEDCIALRP
jgi:hypothetical protein